LLLSPIVLYQFIELGRRQRFGGQSAASEYSALVGWLVTLADS